MVHRNRILVLLAATAGFALPAGPPARSAPPGSDVLLSRLRAGYLRPSEFHPRELRYSASDDAEGDLKEARAGAERAPGDVEIRWKLCRHLEACNHPDAVEEWGVLLGLVRAERRRRPDDLRLREREIEALLGAGLAGPALDAAAAFVRDQPRSAQAHLHTGDAQFARAEGAWREVLRLADAGKATGETPALKTLLEALDASRGAYNRSVELAPAELAPRGARLLLAERRRRMFAFLPPGVVPRIDERPRALALTELRELLDRRPGDPVAAWHAARLLADIALGSDRVDDLRVALENVSTALGERRDALAEETRGYLAMAGGDWDGAAAKMAAAASSARRPAREWATYCRWRSAQAHPEARARLRAESGTSSLTSDRTLQALLVLEEEPLAAVELLRAAVETDPQHQASRYLLGVLLLQRNPDSREGRRHLTRVFEADAVDPEAAFAYLIIQLMDGDRDAARDALRELEQEELVDADLRSRIRATLGVID